MEHEEWEGIAREALDATCTSHPVDAFALAASLDLEVRRYDGPGALLDRDGAAIYLTRRPTRESRQHGLVAHEIGHWLLGMHGHPDSEDGARYLSGALLAPRQALYSQLRRSWSFAALRAAHPNASCEMLARRITQVRPSVATVIDGRRVTARVASPWLEVSLQRMTEWEAAMVREVRELGLEVLIDGPAVAAPAGGERVIVVVRQWRELLTGGA